MYKKYVLLSLFGLSQSLAQDIDTEELLKLKDLGELSDLAGQVEAVVAEELTGESTNVVHNSATGKVYNNNDFIDVNWSGQNLSGYTFTSVNFFNSNLSGVDFSNAVFTNTDFSDSILDGACFYGARFSNTDIDYGSSVKNSNFSNTTLHNSDIDGDTSGAVWKDKVCGSKAAVDTSVKSTGLNISTVVETNLDLSNLVRADLIKADSIITGLKMGDSKGVDLTINFATDSDKLSGKAQVQVYEMAQALKSDVMKGNRFMIQGHTDSDGDADYNVDLSYRRALRVSRELSEEYGVSTSVLSVDGLGESQPLTVNNSAQGKAINRRVTLINLGKN